MTPEPTSRFEVRGEISDALAAGKPVVALESTVYAHGLPVPVSLDAATKMTAAVRDEGAVPAAVGILSGRIVVGLSEGEIGELAKARNVAKVGMRDLGPVTASSGRGATTVAATAWTAGRTGIRVLATGGIGGVHRGAERTFDVSADLAVLSRTPVAVVCSGAKIVLDLPRTLEVLETLGVPVVGVATGELPAFYARDSGLVLEHRVDSPRQAAALMQAQRGLGLRAGIVFAHPPPASHAVDRRDLDAVIEAALAEARAEGVVGKDVTPYLLTRLAGASDGRTLDANVALLEANARLAARIASAYSMLQPGHGDGT